MRPVFGNGLTRDVKYTGAVSEVTRLLGAIGQGDRHAAEDLLPAVYEELRRLATLKMAHEAPGQTLQPTALVHEAWLRLASGQNPSFEGRAHFFAAAAEAMRRILIDKARRKHARKRGAGCERLDLDQVDVAAHADDDALLLVNDALDRLAAEEPQSAELVKLRFFVGMTNAEAAQALGISERSAKRHWTYARAWLYRAIRQEAPG